MSIESKKCPYCGGDYEYNDDWTTWVNLGSKKCCDECKGIQKLQDLLKEYFQNFL